MKKLLILTICLLALAGYTSGAVAASNTVPIVNIEDKVVEQDNIGLVEQCIKIAANDKGWAIKEIKAGLIEVTMSGGGQNAVVSIPYTGKNYSIIYKSSSAGLNAGKGKISGIYNTWVQELDAEITRHLSRDF